MSIVRGAYALVHRLKGMWPFSSKRVALSRNYFLGLRYLLNEQPDKAVDVFIKLVEVDSDTLETHFALGSLFRQRGEVDRAIRIHQNLLARPLLPKAERATALLALARDYMQAGWLDRAEEVLLQAKQFGYDYDYKALSYLLDIYQQEHAWDKALDAAKQLHTMGIDTIPTTIAYYYCEKAEQAIASGGSQLAEKYARQALSYAETNPRANIMLARLLLAQKEYSQALRYYERIKIQQPAYLSEVLNQMLICYLALGQEAKWLASLPQLKSNAQPAVMLQVADYLLQAQGVAAAQEFVIDHCQAHPSLEGLTYLLRLLTKDAANAMQTVLAPLVSISQQVLAPRSTYRCRHCGFSAKTLDWLCPGCKHWGTVQPWFNTH